MLADCGTQIRYKKLQIIYKSRICVYILSSFREQNGRNNIHASGYNRKSLEMEVGCRQAKIFCKSASNIKIEIK